MSGVSVYVVSQCLQFVVLNINGNQFEIPIPPIFPGETPTAPPGYQFLSTVTIDASFDDMDNQISGSASASASATALTEKRAVFIADFIANLLVKIMLLGEDDESSEAYPYAHIITYASKSVSDTILVPL
uniref:Uncharacterized protein n=1 Tax=viral metagenome TaxID=1070528 RepID=A0A6C0BB01_9ZZZZ